MLAKPDTL